MTTSTSHPFSLAQLPKPAERRIALHITRDAERHLRGGHPWLFADSIVRQSHDGKPGDLAVVFDQKRRFLAIGLYDPTSPIRVRMLQQGQSATIGQQWFQEKLAQAAQLRTPLHNDPSTTGYRLVYGENDGLPGLVIDRYDTTWVLKIYSSGWIPHLADLRSALIGEQPVERLVIRMSRNVASRPDYPLRLERVACECRWTTMQRAGGLFRKSWPAL
ncbi:MAG: hypothetical protein R2932_08730 [Caldilineaceae bacterium]